MLLLFRFSLIKQPTTSIHTECFHPPLLHSHFDSFREREANINPSTQAPHSAPLLTGQGTPGKSLLQSVPSLAVGIQPTFTGHHTLSTKQAHNTSLTGIQVKSGRQFVNWKVLHSQVLLHPAVNCPCYTLNPKVTFTNLISKMPTDNGSTPDIKSNRETGNYLSSFSQLHLFFRKRPSGLVFIYPLIHSLQALPQWSPPLGTTEATFIR